MKCEIIKDLLCQYFDGVCSEETAAEYDAKNLIKHFTDGDIDYVADRIDLYGALNGMYSCDYDSMREYSKAALEDFYTKYLQGQDWEFAETMTRYCGYVEYNADSELTVLSETVLLCGGRYISFNVYERTGL